MKHFSYYIWSEFPLTARYFLYTPHEAIPILSAELLEHFVGILCVVVIISNLE